MPVPHKRFLHHHKLWQGPAQRPRSKSQIYWNLICWKIIIIIIKGNSKKKKWKYLTDEWAERRFGFVAKIKEIWKWFRNSPWRGRISLSLYSVLNIRDCALCSIRELCTISGECNTVRKTTTHFLFYMCVLHALYWSIQYTWNLYLYKKPCQFHPFQFLLHMHPGIM